MKPAVLVGMAVGDALGMPFEKPDDTVHPDLSGWDGNYKPGTWHKLPPGHWTDDTEMAVCLAESLIAKGTYDLHDVSKRYLAWAQGTPHGMGGTTKEAMRLLGEGVSPEGTGQTFDDLHKVGSGTAMRIAPLGWFCRETPSERSRNLIKWAVKDADITHRHVEAYAAAVAVAQAVRLRDVNNPESWLRLVSEQVRIATGPTPTLVAERLFHLSTCLADDRHPEAVVSTWGVTGRRGNAWQIVTSALYCAAYHWTNYQMAVFDAIALGGDTDTRAAITGAIMGARLGLDKIPVYLRDGLFKLDELVALDEALTNA